MSRSAPDRLKPASPAAPPKAGFATLSTAALLEQFPELSQASQHPTSNSNALVVPAEFEEQYYMSLNLQEQLGRLFRPVRPERIDEDLLVELCEQAQTLVRSSAMMDDSVQLFYRALTASELTVTGLVLQRPASQHQETTRPSVQPHTATLQALKRLWAYDWSFEQVLERLDHSGKIGLEARPSVVYLR